MRKFREKIKRNFREKIKRKFRKKNGNYPKKHKNVANVCFVDGQTET